MNGKYWLICLGLMIALSAQGFAQGTAAASEPSAHDTNKALLDPTQPIKSFIFFDQVTVNYYNQAGTSNAINFQPVIPFTFLKHSNILRMTIPYGTGGVGGQGLKPMQIFNLTMFKAGKAQFGVGPVLNFMTDYSGIPSEDRIQAGPAFAYVRPIGNWTFGALQQNLYSPRVKITAIQPIIAYAFPKGWSVNAGQTTYAWEWESGGGMKGVPLGASIGKLVTFPGKQKQMMKFSVNPEYNAKATEGAAHWTLRFYAILLVK